MKTILFSMIAIITLLGSIVTLVAAENTANILSSGAFVKKEKSIKGDWEVREENGRLILSFSDNFKARSGPDLKVFLSPTSIDTVSGDTATQGAVLLGELKKQRGKQEYLLPEGLELKDFQSVLVHCKQYSVLWGGGKL